jgi:flagellar biosynthesis protein FlhF
MPTRTLTAPSLPEAMARIRAELGAQAVVTGWRRTAAGIEMDVAIPDATGMARDAAGPAARTEAAPRARPTRPVAGNPEVMADKAEFDAWNAVLPARSGKPRAPRHDVFGAPARPAAPKAAASPAGPAPRTAPVRAAGLTKAAAGLRPGASALASAAPSAASRATAPEGARPRRGLSPRQLELIGLGLPAPSLKDWASVTGADDLAAGLDGALRQRVALHPLPDGTGLPVALVGAPGSGKTVTLAKLAARLLGEGQPVAIISTDTDRMGGTDQLQGFAGRLGARFDSAGSLLLAARLVRQAMDRGEAALIDTPAASHLSAPERQLCARIAEDCGARMLLCLPADGRADDLAEMAACWGADAPAAQPSAAILTRLDLTHRRLGAVDALMRAGLPLAGLCASPYVADGLEQATIARLAGLTLQPLAEQSTATPVRAVQQGRAA